MDKRALRVQSPCTFDWNQMTPADKGRFCAQCKKVVHDLSRMTEREARALLSQERNEELCVRFVYDQRGQVFFAGDRAPLVPAALLHRAKRAALATAALVALEGCSMDASPFDSLTSGGGHGPRNANDPVSSQEYMSTTGGVAYDPSMDRPLFGDDASVDAGTRDGASDAANGDAAPVTDAAPDAGPDSAL